MINKIYFNPLDTHCKNIKGAVSEKETLQLTVFLLKEERPEDFAFKTPEKEECISSEMNAFLKLAKDGGEDAFFLMEKCPFGWTISLKINEIGLYFYSFHFENGENISCGECELGFISNNHQCQPFLLTVYAQTYQTPEWFKGGIMYQIFPDRFCKKGTMPDINGRIHREWGDLPYFQFNEDGKVLNNDFFGGNFKGIESKLDYLKDLGVTVLYLNPIFEAASNHRYDTSDYKKIDPFLGDENDLKNLISAAKSKGIRIILDGVFNHTGDNSVYFNKYGKYPDLGAYQSKQSPYYSWYRFEEFPDKYASWWGIDTLPEVNENSEDYQNFIFGTDGVLKKWLAFGIGGYRLDVADELPDFFLKKLRKSVKESNKNAIIIGEVWEDASNKIAYSQRREYLQGLELDSVMNYPLKDAIIAYMQTGNAQRLLSTVCALINHYPKKTLDCLMNILGTHDTPRILTVLGGIYCKNKEEMALKTAYLDEDSKKIAVEKLKMAAVLQYMFPGVPCIYYGDENGMEGHIDPFCRQCFNWNELNEDLISFYKKLGKLRKKYKRILKDGEFEPLTVKNGLLYFKRIKNDDEIYVCVNNSSNAYLFDISEDYQNCLDLQIYQNNISVNPYSYLIFKKFTQK